MPARILTLGVVIRYGSGGGDGKERGFRVLNSNLTLCVFILGGTGAEVGVFIFGGIGGEVGISIIGGIDYVYHVYLHLGAMQP